MKILEQATKELKPLLLGILFFFICNSIGYVITNKENFELRKEFKELNTKIDSLNDIINSKQPPFQKEVTLTVYHPVESQCDNTPLITANGTKIDLEKLKNGEIKYCAVSRDLLKEFPYGSMIYIDGYEEYKVVDTMNKRITNTVDILQDENEPIFKLLDVKITKMDNEISSWNCQNGFII